MLRYVECSLNTAFYFFKFQKVKYVLAYNNNYNNVMNSISLILEKETYKHIIASKIILRCVKCSLNIKSNGYTW